MLFSVILLAAVVSALPGGPPGGQCGHGGPCSQPGGSSTQKATSTSQPTSSSSHATTSTAFRSSLSSSHAVASTVSTSATPSASGVTNLPWAPAGPGDIRSPCPALNSLANHYLLPHDGHYITSANATAAFQIGMNMDPALIANIVTGALAQCTNQTGSTCTGFHLGMLNTPHSLEHDGSLSRYDYNFGKGNNREFNASVWNQVMDIWSATNTVDFALMQKARTERFAVANATDLPGWFLANFGASYGEAAFILSVFGDPVVGNARKDWVHYWFTNERLPFALGWAPDQRGVTSGATMAAMVAKIQAA